mmetsp:Transcript_83459/g.183443  ORF Transcript_83459/g.183443 Transcript_83459/m.183443 type:complete len:312 (-) Transcript_83459:452-1387(-)
MTMFPSQCGPCNGGNLRAIFWALRQRMVEVMMVVRRGRIVAVPWGKLCSGTQPIIFIVMVLHSSHSTEHESRWKVCLHRGIPCDPKVTTFVQVVGQHRSRINDVEQCGPHFEKVPSGDWKGPTLLAVRRKPQPRSVRREAVFQDKLAAGGCGMDLAMVGRDLGIPDTEPIPLGRGLPTDDQGLAQLDRGSNVSIGTFRDIDGASGARDHHSQLGCPYLKHHLITQDELLHHQECSSRASNILQQKATLRAAADVKVASGDVVLRQHDGVGGRVSPSSDAIGTNEKDLPSHWSLDGMKSQRRPCTIGVPKIT